MRRFFQSLMIGLVCLSGTLHAQDAAAEAASARARQKEAEERYGNLEGKLNGIIETQEAFRKRQERLEQKLSELSAEFDVLKKAHTTTGANAVTQDQFKKLAEAVQEIAKNQESDKKLFLKTLEDLSKSVVPAPSTPTPSKVVPSTAADEGKPETYVYIAKKGDDLGTIITEYNKEFAKRGQASITRAQVLEVNPDLKANPNRIFVGKKILIPVPPAKGAKTNR